MPTMVVVLLLSDLVLGACGEDDEDQPPHLDHGELTVDEAVAAVHVPCLDVARDFALTMDDAIDFLEGGGTATGMAIDFNADGVVDERDAVFVDAGLQLTPDFDHAICDEDPPIEYLVGAANVPAIVCEGDAYGLIIVGVAGGIVDLRAPDNGAGVRWMVNALVDELRARGDVQTLTVIAGPGLPGIEADLNAAMEAWLTSSVETLLEQYPCADVVFLGHSHGAVTSDVVAARIEAEHADRVALVVSIDRVEALYLGDTDSRRQQAPVFNVYETNDPDLHGAAYEAPNVENWDASGERAPANGEGGGPLEPVDHTTIDNSPGVRDRVIAEVLDRLS